MNGLKREFRLNLLLLSADMVQSPYILMRMKVKKCTYAEVLLYCILIMCVRVAIPRSIFFIEGGRAKLHRRVEQQPIPEQSNIVTAIEDPL